MRAASEWQARSQTTTPVSGGTKSVKVMAKSTSRHGGEPGASGINLGESARVPLETEVRRQALRYIHQHPSTAAKETASVAAVTASSLLHTNAERKPEVPRLARRASKTARPPSVSQTTSGAVAEEGTQTSAALQTARDEAVPEKEPEKVHPPRQVSETTQTSECMPQPLLSFTATQEVTASEHTGSDDRAADVQKPRPPAPTQHKLHHRKAETVKSTTADFAHTAATFPGARRVDDEVIPLRTKIYVGAGIVFGVLIAGYLVRCCMRLDMMSAAGVAVHDGVRRVLAPTNSMFSSAKGDNAPWRTRFRTRTSPTTRTKAMETTTTAAATTLSPEQVVGRIRDRLIEHKLQKVAT